MGFARVLASNVLQYRDFAVEVLDGQFRELYLFYLLQNSQESSGEPPSVVTTDPQMDSVSANLCVEESPTENGSESEERCAWQITEVGREEHHISPSMISSSGSTGSVESIDSHQSHLYVPVPSDSRSLKGMIAVAGRAPPR